MESGVRSLLRRFSPEMERSVSALPGPVRGAMGLGYLLCRAADAIGEVRPAARKERRKALEAFRAAFTGSGPGLPPAPLRGKGSGLLKRLPEMIALWRGFPEEERALLKDVVHGVCEGVRMDLTLFPGDGPADLRAFDFASQLERYCAHAGGAPGLFWVRVCRLRLDGVGDADPDLPSDRGFRLGRGLKMTNVLRGLARDLRIGRCYLPSEELAEVRLRPRDLLEPTSVGRLRPVLLKWVRWTLAELEAGAAYASEAPAPKLRTAVGRSVLDALEALLGVLRSPDLLRVRGKAAAEAGKVYRILAGPPPASRPGAFSRRFEALRTELASELEV